MVDHNFMKINIDRILVGLPAYTQDEYEDRLSSYVDYEGHTIPITFIDHECDEREEVCNKGHEDKMSERAQKAFEYLLDQAKMFNSSDREELRDLEHLFYYLIYKGYEYQRHSADKDIAEIDLISFDHAGAVLDDDLFGYFSHIYVIFKQAFLYWVWERDSFRYDVNGIGFRVLLDNIPKEYWDAVKKLASDAHDIMPEGEIAGRIMLIADLQLIYGSVEDNRKVTGPETITMGKNSPIIMSNAYYMPVDRNDPKLEELVKYLNFKTEGRKGFIDDCFVPEGFDERKKYFDIVPFIDIRRDVHIASRKCKEVSDNVELLDELYYFIMMYPCTIHVSNTVGADLLTSNVSLIKSQNTKNEMIRDFSHRYKNMTATSLYDVAMALLKMDDKDLKRYGRTILLEYGDKNARIKEVAMLRLDFENKQDEMIGRVRDTILPLSAMEDDSEISGFTISDIIERSVKQCLISLFHNGSDEMKRVRKECFKREGVMLNPLRESFEEDILFNDSANVLSWMKERLFDIRIELSETWHDLRFKKDASDPTNASYSTIILTDLFVELIMNVFKYADRNRPVYINLSESTNELYISLKNNKKADVSGIPSSGVGLDSEKQRWERLNKAVAYNGNTLELKSHDDIFELNISISKEIFWR